MRASRQEQVGGAGVSEVCAAFERLNWGVAENTRHDLGTDVFAMARNERLFDLGLVVGVQVKAGDSYFDEPMRDETSGAVRGWWFRDDDRSHIDAWLAHGLPHLIVLHDLNMRTSYWAHVTPQAVVSTGIGAKVLVPITNTVDDAHRDALLRVAATPRPRAAWEGSAWTGASSLAPRDRLRHALVVPRLIAPHPNAGHDVALGPEQALALLVQTRVSDLDRFAATQADVPTLSDASGSPQWSWRFVGALGERLLTGEIDGLLQVVEDAPDQAARTASTATAAAGLLEDGQADEAIGLIEAALACDDAEPIDHAWLTLQHARACAEIGRVDAARIAAVDVQAIRVTHPDDVTATAIAGVAGSLLFNTSRWGELDVADVIIGADTTAAWWRTQTMSWALGAVAERTFKAWGRDRSVTVGGSDVAHDQLFAASLTANYLGDQGSWRHLCGLLGQDTLLRLNRNADPEAARRALGTLRLAGDEESLKLAVLRLAADGPATAVTLAAAEVDLIAATRTTGPTDLSLLQHGGDLLDEATAARSATWLLDAIRDSSAFATRTSPSYLLVARLVDTLAAVVPAASATARHAVLDHLKTLTAQPEQYLATSWARVVYAMPAEAWDEHAALLVGREAGDHHAVLQLPMLGVASRYDPSVRARLVEEARGGSLDALGALGDVRVLPIDVVTNLVAALTERVNQQVCDAQNGMSSVGVHNYGHTLALLNLWHPDAADWPPLLALLEDRNVGGNHKRAALQVLASLVDRLPALVRSRLEAITGTIMETPARWTPFGDIPDAVGAGTDLAAALGCEEGADRLLDLLVGDADHRQWAARAAGRLGRRQDTGVLVTLAQDSEPEVRAAAAAGLASLVAAGSDDSLAFSGLQRCLLDPGSAVPFSIADTLASAPSLEAGAQEALIGLRRHPSVRVRLAATGVIER